ncbi:hypothetical protein ACSBOB_00785 [Mesorhizobium sp. ASY16-5R]|uniref:hypothetical protein n=1 Tax=Mesorhizobium sp. ASY16-5R TaxID=3445772 RepID=UPI003FA179F3
MNFISVMAITEAIAREQAAAQTGYDPHTIGPLATVIDQGTNSRQRAFVFETANDVDKHPLFAKALLSDAIGATVIEADGPVLVFGPEVTVGG